MSAWNQSPSLAAGASLWEAAGAPFDRALMVKGVADVNVVGRHPGVAFEVDGHGELLLPHGGLPACWPRSRGRDGRVRRVPIGMNHRRRIVARQRRADVGLLRDQPLGPPRLPRLRRLALERGIQLRIERHWRQT